MAENMMVFLKIGPPVLSFLHGACVYSPNGVSFSWKYLDVSYLKQCMQIFKAENFQIFKDNYLHSERFLIYRKYLPKGYCEQQGSLECKETICRRSCILLSKVHLRNEQKQLRSSNRKIGKQEKRLKVTEANQYTL